jgi:hypothetical protein
LSTARSRASGLTIQNKKLLVEIEPLKNAHTRAVRATIQREAEHLAIYFAADLKFQFALRHFWNFMSG